MSTQRVLVIGGAGRSGRRIVDLLLADGHEVVVGSRSPREVPDAATSMMVDLAAGVPETVDDVDGVIITVETPLDPAGADALMHRGVASVAERAAERETPVVLISQIYIERLDEHPEMANWIPARAAGEQALRDSGTPYTIIRPGWLTNEPADGARLEQGDTGDGNTSRELVAQACVAALFDSAAHGKTFELYDGSSDLAWPHLFAELTPDAR